MITLYHWTNKKNVSSIEQTGLKRDKWCVYLCRHPEQWHGDVCYEVLLNNSFYLSTLNDWEVMCWNSIPIDRIKRIK